MTSFVAGGPGLQQGAAALRIEHIELTFMNLPLVRKETWAWGDRSVYTVGLLELHTDAGITGLGEVAAWIGPDPRVIEAMTTQMAQLLRGESALTPERIVNRVMGAGWYPFHRTASLVLGGIETACWDAMGKHYGQPLATLLGGALRDSLPTIYWVQADDDIDEMLEQGADAAARGFESIYFKVGFEEERDVEVVARMRERLGPGPKIRPDANEAWSAGTAVRILRRMAPHVIEYIEQPTSMFDLDGLAHVRAASGVCVAANQASWGGHSVLDIIRRNAADVIMTDPHQEPGLSATKKVLGLCELAKLPFVNHATNSTTITLTSHLHLMSTSTACVLPVQAYPDYFADDYVVDPYDSRDGRARIRLDRPGLGVELDRDKIAKYHQVFLQDGVATQYPDTADAQIPTIPKL